MPLSVLGDPSRTETLINIFLYLQEYRPGAHETIVENP
jgi:hypothetical protein